MLDVKSIVEGSMGRKKERQVSHQQHKEDCLVWIRDVWCGGGGLGPVTN